MTVGKSVSVSETLPKTPKEWGWFFYQELGYRIVEDEEEEIALQKAMEKVVQVDRTARNQQLQDLINELKNQVKRPMQEAGVFDPMEQAGFRDMTEAKSIINKLEGLLKP